MAREIGKTMASEKTPSTIDYFYFWTRSDQLLAAFDVVKVEHLNQSTTYGVVEEMCHITDSAGALTDFISSDFGIIETEPPTNRIGMNCVKARVVDNTKGVYTPVLDGKRVCLADREEICRALGLAASKHRIPCGYVEMYKGMGEDEQVAIPAGLDARYLIGPEGAHLNISGISGLAAKTSYAMFLLKSIQDSQMKSGDDDADGAAFVIFNVKGRDLLAIDQPIEFESKDEKEQTHKLYELLGIAPEPFQNVRYFYPASRIGDPLKTYLDEDSVAMRLKSDSAKMYQFDCEKDIENLDLLFADQDDPAATMESIISTVISGEDGFGKITEWDEFCKEVAKRCQTGQKNKEIPVQSWRKFSRVINRAVKNNPVFGTRVSFNKSRPVRLNDELEKIRKNDVFVIDVARLNEVMQTFVFGSVLRKVSDLQLDSYPDVPESERPSKIVVFIDELNKYASGDAPKNSPILRLVLDVAERGRSLGVILFGAEQFKSAVHDRVAGNCSTLAYGRTNAIEVAKNDYRFISPVFKNMMTRLEQGEYIIQNPVFRSLLKISFPKPVYKQFQS